MSGQPDHSLLLIPDNHPSSSQQPAPSAEPLLQAQQAPYVAPPQYSWEPGVQYEVGRPVSYDHVFSPEDDTRALPFEQQQIRLDQHQGPANKGCHCVGCWGASFFTSIVVLGTLPLSFVLHNYLWMILPGVVYLIHWILFACSDTRKFLKKLRRDVNAYEMTYRCQQTPAHTKWSIVCYHYETRHSSSTDSDGQTTINTYRERVVTYSKNRTVHFKEQYDASPILSGLEKFKFTRIYNKVKLAFVNKQQHARFAQERKKWVHLHTRDKHQDFYQEHVIPGLISHALVYNGKPGQFPALLNCTIFTLLAVLTLDWILMFWLMRHSARLDYAYSKIVHRV